MSALRTQTLVEITSEMEDLYDSIIEAGVEGIDNEEVQDKLHQWEMTLEGNLKEKTEAYCHLIRECELRSKARKEEANRIHDLAKRDEGIAKSLKERLKWALVTLGRDSVDTDTFRVKIANNGGALPLEIDDAMVPDGFKINKPFTDKDAIREALDGGEELSFAQYGERGTHLRVR